MHRRWIVPAAVVLVVAAASTVALASIPDSSGVIHGCRNQATGVLRVIDSDAGQHCLPTEAELTWAQQGPPGPAGTGRELVERSESIDTTPPGSGSDVLRINEVVQCPAGKAAVNGGYRFDDAASGYGTDRHVFGGPDGTDWRVIDSKLVSPPYPVPVTLWALCVSA